MKVLRSWLSDYVDIKLNNEELAEKLSLSGTAVEDIVYGLDEKVIVVEIVKIEPHPNADRLRLATINTGKDQKVIVCGAPNIEIGQKVPLAQLGAILPGNFEIKKANIRGVESEGMLCAADELGLGEDHSGIIVLPSDHIVGKPLREYLYSDALFDIEITPNRGDCLSHIGISREIAALTATNLKTVKYDYPEFDKKYDDDFSIKVIDESKCYRYSGIKIKDVKIGPSPKWLTDRLIALGAKPINNIVDITNYLMLDCGQPLHAFDAKKISGNRIIIRDAVEGEVITTLDNTTRRLAVEDLVIADNEKSVAIAGIMGGLNSEVDDTTTEIVLESAEFDPASVRKTSKTLNLSTDASYRFERGIDSGYVTEALKRAVAMIVEIAGGHITHAEHFVSRPLDRASVEFDSEKINILSNLVLERNKMTTVLQSLGFEIVDSTALVPTWRHDVSIWQDLAEEITRIYGYANIPRIEMPKSAPVKRSKYYIKEYIKDTLVDLGFSEIYSYSFLSENDLKTIKIGADDLLEVANPIQPEIKYLKKSLIPGLLKAAAKNPTFDPVCIFEIGQVFTKSTEHSHLGIIVSGKGAGKLIEEAKQKISKRLNILPELLRIQELTSEDLQRFKIKKPITFMIEVNLDQVLPTVTLPEDELSLKIAEKMVHYRPLSKYPSITRDLAFITQDIIDPEEVVEQIYKVSGFIGRVELFDEFSSDKFGIGMKNIAYHIYLQHMDRTMTDTEADEIINNIVLKVEKKFNAKLRK